MEADEDPHHHLQWPGASRSADFHRLSTIRERSQSDSSDSEFFSDLPLPPVPPARTNSPDRDHPPRTPSQEFLYSRMEEFDDEPAAASREDLRPIDSNSSTAGGSSSNSTLHKNSWNASSASVDEGILYIDDGEEDEERSSYYRDKSPILRSVSASPERLLRRRRRRKCRRRRAGEFRDEHATATTSSSAT